MAQLSRREEQILLAVWHLETAYIVSIHKFLSDALGESWSVGAIHKPLRHLEKLGLIDSYLGDASAKRGGRSKRIYCVTPEGMTALEQCSKVVETLWKNFPGFGQAAGK